MIDFEKTYNSIPPCRNELILPFWNSMSEVIKKQFIPTINPDYLQFPAILETMCWGWTKHSDYELEQLTKKFGKDLIPLCIEPTEGNPKQNKIENIQCSGNTIHHLYHLAEYINFSKSDLPEIICEWGGGYGNFSRIYRMFKPNSTYVIIDLPLLSCVQYNYLSNTIGKDNINLIMDNFKVIPNKINIVPLSLIENIQYKCELFISTWALSESSEACFNILKKLKFFSANHFLMAGQVSSELHPSAEKIKSICEGLTIKNITFLPENYYVFK